MKGAPMAVIKKTEAARRKTQVRILRARGFVTALLTRGYTHEKIKQVLYERQQLSYKTTQKLIDHIYEKWKNDGEQDMRIKRRRAIEARREVISAAWARGNLDVVLRAEDSLANVEGTFFKDGTADDHDINFNISIIGTDKDAAIVDEYENDLEHPEKFDQRMERQLDTFTKNHGVRD